MKTGNKVMSTKQLEEIYTTLFHQGITKYKTKNSKAYLPELVEAQKLDKLSKKGAIFVVRSKEDFNGDGVSGYIVTSIETLLEDAKHLTHFTPNVYRQFHYTDKKRTKIKGFEEKNLKQINAFVIDIDTKRYSVQEILLACLDESIGVPTLIVETERGYQVYFLLDRPLFISNKNDYISLTVAKRIADNIKKSLQSVEADQFCNDFGFFRLPKQDNIAWLQLEQTYDINTLINWSQRQDDDLGRSLFVVPSKTTKTMAHTQSEWFFQLLNTTNVKGSKGQIGRNNTMFTLALACYADGWKKNRTFNLLDEYNTRQHSPLSTKEIRSLLNSAYSGEYNGPKKEFVETLLEYYAEGKTGPVKFSNGGNWYKPGKKREDRVNSHYEEWEEDILKYVSAKKDDAEMFLWHTQKEMCAAIGIASSSLNELLKRTKKLVKVTEGKGRGAKTGWTTVQLFIKYFLKQVIELKEKKSLYLKGVREIIDEYMSEIKIVAGYEQVIEFFEKLSVATTTHETIQDAGAG